MDIIGVDVNGCFAPYVVLPESNIWKVDPEISDDQACLFDPFGNAMHTVMAQPISGKQVLVTGCGTIGLMAIGIVHAGGADRVIAVEPNPIKQKMAKIMGADVVLDRADEGTVKKMTDRDGVDVLLEMSGHPKAINDGFRCVRNGGQVSLLGIPGGEVVDPVGVADYFQGVDDSWDQRTENVRHVVSVREFSEAISEIDRATHHASTAVHGI